MATTEDDCLFLVIYYKTHYIKMKIRLLSDLHIDINAPYKLQLEDNNDFVLIAGDVSGDPIVTETWIKQNIKNGIFVAGNHIVYNKRGQTISELKQYLGNKFTLDSNITFLDSEINIVSKEVNGILFVGTTLYTDYNLNNNIKFDMRVAENLMNDFRWGIHSRNDNSIENKSITNISRLTPSHYLEYFNKSIQMLDEVISENESNISETKPVIVLTHHCPSTEFIADKYKDSMYNASYVSNLEYFMEKHPSIKLWLSGHIHNRIFKKYTRQDGSEIKLIANPRGYERSFETFDWTKDVFIDTDTWEVFKLGEKSTKIILV